MWRGLRPGSAVRIRLPVLNSVKLKHSLVLRTGRRQAEEKLWPVLKKIGQERILWAIQNDRSIVQLVIDKAPPEVLKQAGQYEWAMDMLSDQDLLSFLPEWYIKLAISCGDQGKVWIAKELKALRGLFAGREHAEG